MARRFSHLAILSCIFTCYLSYNISVSQAKDTLGVNESFVLYNGDLLESSSQPFRLSIISGADWTYFLAIQYVYKNQSIDVWVHDNFQTPARTEPSYLTMGADGRLVVENNFHSLLIFVNKEQPEMINGTTATLLDNGNLVLRAPGGIITVWQSFDYPCSTWLQGMKVGIFDLGTIRPRQSILTSLSTLEEPNSTLCLDLNSSKELLVMQDGVVYWRSGVWDGKSFNLLDFTDSFDVTFSYFSNSNETYFTWNSSTDPCALLLFSTTGNITISSGDLNTNQTMAVCDEIDKTKGIKNYQSMGCTNPCGEGDGFREILAELNVWDDYSFGVKLADCWDCRISLSRIGKFIPSDAQRIFVRDSLFMDKELNSTISPKLAPGPSSALAPSPSSVVAPPIPARKKKANKWKVCGIYGLTKNFLDIADPSLGESVSMHETLRYVQVGLLCVQENAADRPTMSDVVSKLKMDSLNMVLPIPNRPAFAAITNPLNNDNFVQNPESYSISKATISELEGR
ncbi:hypothetical protein ACH5RR_025152 [Cinchona calisaya]|uniref:Bulb-type lectin domain-containing protein n=1 Tax=Cinchona calisaya TaxID=153742 RepID=A0ABD2YYT7_9GENT